MDDMVDRAFEAEPHERLYFLRRATKAGSIEQVCRFPGVPGVSSRRLIWG